MKEILELIGLLTVAYFVVFGIAMIVVLYRRNNDDDLYR